MHLKISSVRVQIKKTSNLRVAVLCEGNSPVTGELIVQRGNNAENVSIWWRFHDDIPNYFVEFEGTQLSQFQWSNPDEYGEIRHRNQLK